MKNHHGLFTCCKKPVGAHILMPVFNAESFLNSSIESVLDQHYKNIKLLIFDDGSTDGSSAIINNLQKSHPDKIMVRRIPANAGVANARKNLFQWSKELNPNAYLFSLDADDKIIDPYFVGDVIHRMRHTKADICLFNFAIRFENSKQEANASVLYKELSNVTEILHQIYESPHHKIKPLDLPNILKFTSLGGTKCYAPSMTMPETDNSPYEDFPYMAILLKAKTITALPPRRMPIEYLRRSNSVCGKRTSENFTTHIPTQLYLFFLNVCMDSQKSADEMQKILLAQEFVLRKLSAYQELLGQLITSRTYPDINQTTLDKFLIAKNSLETFMKAIVSHVEENLIPHPDSSYARVLRS